MASSGLGSQFGLKKEGTWGSAETVAVFYEYENESFSVDPTYYDSSGLRAQRTFAPSSRTRQTTRQAGGSVTMEAPTKLLGHILDQMVAGTVTPSLDSGSSYTSTFNVGASVPNKSATLQFNKPTTQGNDTPFTYTGSVLTEAAFSLEMGGALMLTTTWASRDELTPGTSPSGPSLATASYTDGIACWVHTDTLTLNINGTPAAAVTSINWTWTQPYKLDRFFLNNSGTRAKPIPNGLATIEGTMNAEWYDTSFYDLFRSGAFASLVFAVEHPTAISSSHKPTLTNTWSAVQFRGTSPQVGGPDILTQNIPFTVKDNGTNAPWVAALKSTSSTAF